MKLDENKIESSPAGGALVGKKDGQTIIHDKGTMSGYLVGKLHKDGGIKAVNKSTGQPLEMQGGEVVITAPAVADQTKREFEGKMMTNREILSAINEKGGGVAFANGGDIPAKIHTTDEEYEYGGKMMQDTEIANILGWNSTLKKGGQIFSFFDKVYDVEKAYKLINSRQIIYDIKEIDTFPVKYQSLNKEYSKNLKPDFSVAQGLMVKDDNGQDLLIDGNHRMNNAYENGVKKIRVYYIGNPKTIAKFSKKKKFELGGENKVGGHLSKGKSLKQIAEMHNVSLTHINEQLAKGLEVEKEHFADFKERTRVVKDHLVENPNYYTLLQKAGLKKGGKIQKQELVKKSEKGDTPARDLNNYNDILDVQADGVVGGDNGLAFADGGSVGVERPKVSYVVIGETGQSLSSLKERRFNSYIEFAEELKKTYESLGRKIRSYVILKAYDEDGKMLLAPFTSVSDQKNTVKNFNPYTGSFKNLEKSLSNSKAVSFPKYDWTDWLESKNVNGSNTPLSSSSSLKSNKINDEVVGITISYRMNNELKEVPTINEESLLDALKSIREKDNPVGVKLEIYDWVKQLNYKIINFSVAPVLSNEIDVDTISNSEFKDFLSKTLFPEYDFELFFKQRNAKGQQSTSNSVQKFDFTNTKINVWGNLELSKKVQKTALENGWEWEYIGKTIDDNPLIKYLYFTDKKISYGTMKSIFDNNPKREITESEIFGSQQSVSVKNNAVDLVRVKYSLKGSEIERSFRNGEDLNKEFFKIEEYCIQNPDETVTVEVTAESVDGTGRITAETDRFNFGEKFFKPRNWTYDETKKLVQEEWFNNVFDFNDFFYKSINQQTQYPEYYEFVGDNGERSFTKGKIYKIRNPKNIEEVDNFIDNYGDANGFRGRNFKNFKPSTKEAFLAQNDDKIKSFTIEVSGFDTVEANNINQLFLALEERKKIDSTILLKYKTPKGGNKQFGAYFKDNPNAYYELKRDDFSIDYLKEKLNEKEWFPNEISDEFFNSGSPLISNTATAKKNTVDLIEVRYGVKVIGSNDSYAYNSENIYSAEKLVDILRRLYYGDFKGNVTLEPKGSEFNASAKVVHLKSSPVKDFLFKQDDLAEAELMALIEFDLFKEESLDFGDFIKGKTLTKQPLSMTAKPFEVFRVNISYGEGLNQLYYTGIEAGLKLIENLKEIEEFGKAKGEDVNTTITVYAYDENLNKFDRKVNFTIGEEYFSVSDKSDIQIKANLSYWFPDLKFDAFFSDTNQATSVPNNVVPKTLENTVYSLDLAISKLEKASSEVVKKYNAEIYEKSLDFLYETKASYELALKFTPESAFMYERLDLMKKLANIEKEIKKIEDMKQGGTYFMLAKILEKLDRGENWKLMENTQDVITNQIPQSEIEVIIRSQKFKNWFGDWEKALLNDEYDNVSKALTDGKPSVYHHGARRIKYTYREVSNGVLYLAENISYALWFSQNATAQTEEGNYLTECFVNIKNPIDLTAFHVNQVDFGDIVRYIEAMYPLAKIYDFIPPNVALLIKTNQPTNLMMWAWQLIRTNVRFVNHIKENTPYDGFLYYENNPSDQVLNPKTGQYEENITKAVAIFKSPQVKVVDAVLFDGGLDDWRFENGGKLNN